MEDKDLFDWVGFIGGILTIIEWLYKSIKERAKRIEKPRKRPKRSKQRR